MSVDESPLAAHDRRDSLEKHLQTRPDVQDLKDRHILLDTNVAPYVPKPTAHRLTAHDLTMGTSAVPSKPPARNSPANELLTT
jgi:hypothetical protein